MDEVLTLDAAKRHLRIEGTADDADLLDLIQAAIGTVEKHLGRPLIDAERGWPDVTSLPATVIHAIKIVLAELYANRERPRDLSGALDMLIGDLVVVSFG